jgi:hypothetical protein
MLCAVLYRVLHSGQCSETCAMVVLRRLSTVSIGLREASKSFQPVQVREERTRFNHQMNDGGQCVCAGSNQEKNFFHLRDVRGSWVLFYAVLCCAVHLEMLRLKLGVSAKSSSP